MKTYAGHPVPPALTEEWPEGVAFRALTVGWATADVVDAVTPHHDGYETHRLSAHCTGHGCTWAVPNDGTRTFTYNPSVTHVHQVTAALYDLKRQAQVHAERCRIIRRPA